MKNILIITLSLIVASYLFPSKRIGQSVEPVNNSTLNCSFVFGPAKAIECAPIAEDISAYFEEWPENANSTLFFNRIAGNLNLKSISFCGVIIDSLTSSIGLAPNLEDLQLSGGNITYIPKEIGKLKKLKTLILGTSTDECRGNKVQAIPKEIGECKSLEHLGLVYSEVRDLPKELENCLNLKIIDLSYNELISEETIANLRQRFPNAEIVFKQ